MKLMKRIKVLCENDDPCFAKFFLECLSSSCYAISSTAYASLISILEKYLEDFNIKTMSSNICSGLRVLVDRNIGSSKLSMLRFPRLQRLLEDLTDFANTSIPQGDIAETLYTTVSKFKKPKFIHLINSLSRGTSGRNPAPKILIELISSLDEDEIIEVLSDLHVSCDLLEASLIYSPEESNSSAENASTTGNAVRKCASTVTVSILRTILMKLPKISQIQFHYNSHSFSQIDDQTYFNLLENGAKINEYLFPLNFVLKNDMSIKWLNQQDMLIVIKAVNIMLINCLANIERGSHKQIMKIMESTTYIFLNESFVECFTINDDNHALLNQMVESCFWIIREEFKDIDRIKLQCVEIKEVANHVKVLWDYTSILVDWMRAKVFEDGFLKSKRKSKRFAICHNLIVAIARLPCIQSFTRVPLSVHKYGWEPEIKTHSSGRHYSFSNVPVRFLQNIDVLHEFTFRIQWIGWTSKKDFEEIWMGLLGVLSATPVGQELKENSVQEITDRVCTSAFTVKCLTGLLLQSLLHPNPGNPVFSNYVFKSRQVQNANEATTCSKTATILKNIVNNGLQCKSIFDGHSGVIENFASNVERLYNCRLYGVGQFPIETLWSLTGILEEEEELLSSQKDSALENPIHHGSRDRTPTDGDRYRPINVVDFMNSAQDDLNLQSCLHFIIDLYAHWMAGGPDSVPLPLLSATVDSVVLLSDLFTERKQYVWCKEKLTLIHQNRGTTFDDELVMQHTVLSVLRSIAVLGNTGNDSEKETNALIETGLRQVQLSVRISTLRGVLYYLQTLTSDEAVTLMPILSEYILSSLSIYALFDGENVVLDKPQSLDHQLICWAIAFFIIGSFHDPHTKQSFAPKFIEICLKALLNKNAPFIIFEAVCVGIENLFSSSNIESKFIKHLIDFSTNCIKNSRCAKTTLLVVRILIACLYNVKSSQLSIESHSPDFETPRNIMEPAVSAMEKLSLLMYKVSNGSLVEAQILSSVLPIYLVDNFNPGDVMNRIIGELLQFPHHYPKLIMKVLLSIIKALLDREAKEVVLEWLLLSLPSFTHRKPWFYARWCLTSLFLYSSSNDFVSRIYKIASDDNRQDSVGHRLFLLACDAFKSQLKGSTQLESFEQMIKLTLQRNGVATNPS